MLDRSKLYTRKDGSMFWNGSKLFCSIFLLRVKFSCLIWSYPTFKGFTLIAYQFCESFILISFSHWCIPFFYFARLICCWFDFDVIVFDNLLHVALTWLPLLLWLCFFWLFFMSLQTRFQSWFWNMFWWQTQSFAS